MGKLIKKTKGDIMKNDDRIMSSIDNIQRELDSIRAELRSGEIKKSEEEFKTIVKRVDDKNTLDADPGNAKLDGDIETI